MNRAKFVAGDWGTSHLRLFLCAADGTVLDRAQGPGAAGGDGRFAEIYDSLVRPWQHAHGPLRSVLCGMVGSSIGWAEAPYVACPTGLEKIASSLTTLREGSIAIVPGLSCRNRFNAPDFLRGEETQILGALELDPALRRGRQLLCMPGTHTKWVALEDGAVEEFLTAPTGELFAMLCSHSVLVRDPDARVASAAAFERGLRQTDEFPDAQLLHRLFECRSRLLAGELAATAVASFLSGLLIASDVRGALRALSDRMTGRTVHLVGSSDLTQLYASSLTVQNCRSNSIAGAAAALAGLLQIQRRLARGIDNE
jgi:2-dehydro-3-deoxygalactonokinase